MMSLGEILAAQYNNQENKLPHRILALDPGNTTGWCVFEDGELVADGQLNTAVEKGGENGSSCIIDWFEVDQLFERWDWEFDAVVMENYRIYSNKLERHSFSEVPTLRLIGGIEAFCWLSRIPVYYQMATLAKGFIDDKKMEAWGFKKTHSLRHRGDAIRHALYFLIITNLKREFLKAKS